MSDADGLPPVKNQHVVSRVLLKRFAVPTANAGHQVYPFDLHHPGQPHKLKGIGACGTIENFVPFASASLEKIWRRVENRLPDAAAAVERGDIFDHEKHVLVLKDLIALHRTRSLHYREINQQAFAKIHAQGRTALVTTYADRLRAAYLQRTGLHLTGPQGVEAVADQLLQSFVDNHLSGADLRTSIERMFGKLKEAIRETRLEILTPADGQFLIGDTPALPIHQDGTTFSYVTALDDSTAIVLPLGPKHLLVGRAPRDVIAQIPTDIVDLLNTLQIEKADRRVYLHPHSGLEQFVRAHLDAGGRTDKPSPTP